MTRKQLWIGYAILAISVIAAYTYYIFWLGPPERGDATHFEETVKHLPKEHPFRRIQAEVDRRVTAGEDCEPGSELYQLAYQLGSTVGAYAAIRDEAREHKCYFNEVLYKYLTEEAFPLCQTRADSAFVFFDIEEIRGRYKPCVE